MWIGGYDGCGCGVLMGGIWRVDFEWNLEEEEEEEF